MSKPTASAWLGEATKAKAQHHEPLPEKRRMKLKTPPASTFFTAYGVRILQACGLPMQFWILMELLQSVVPEKPDCDFVEYFCGNKAVTKGLLQRGLKGFGYDKKQDFHQEDLQSPLGFIVALVWVLRVKIDEGLIWLGTVCSSWIWLSRGSCRRTRAKPRGGFFEGISVQKGNILTAHSAVLMAIAYARGLIWVLEQPDSSLMKYHPAMKAVRRRLRRIGEPWWQIQTFMGAFDGPTTKGHELYSNSEIIGSLRREHPGPNRDRSVQTAKKTCSKNGKVSVCGGKDLSDSQAYTPAFGHAVATAYIDLRHDERLVSDMMGYETGSESEGSDDNDDEIWDDCRFEDAIDVLKSWQIAADKEPSPKRKTSDISRRRSARP